MIDNDYLFISIIDAQEMILTKWKAQCDQGITASCLLCWKIANFGCVSSMEVVRLLIRKAEHQDNRNQFNNYVPSYIRCKHYFSNISGAIY